MIDRLVQRIDELDNPTVVGLDPRLELIPDSLKNEAFAMFGQTLEGAAAALMLFNKGIIDAVCDLVPAVKLQIAMFERFGVPGMQAFASTVSYAKSKGLIVIGDIKRNDISSTAEAYADGHLGTVKVGSHEYAPFDEDMITLSPYMGSDSVSPYLDAVKNRGKGLFLLIKTSNHGSTELQDLTVVDDQGQRRTVYERVGLLVNEWGRDYRGECGYSEIGAVVGATFPKQAVRLRKLVPHVFFLVPGYGAQGGTAEDLRGVFDADGRGVIVNSARGIIFAYHGPKYEGQFTADQYQDAARRAVVDMREALNQVRG